MEHDLSFPFYLENPQQDCTRKLQIFKVEEISYLKQISDFILKSAKQESYRDTGKILNFNIDVSLKIINNDKYIRKLTQFQDLDLLLWV